MRNALGSVTVLAVDDHPRFLEAARAVVEATPGFSWAGGASSGTEALDAVGREQPDLVLADVNMPEMDGFALARELSRSDPDILVALVSPSIPTSFPRGEGDAATMSCSQRRTFRPSWLHALWREHRVDPSTGNSLGPRRGRPEQPQTHRAGGAQPRPVRDLGRGRLANTTATHRGASRRSCSDRRLPARRRPLRLAAWRPGPLRPGPLRDRALLVPRHPLQLRRRPSLQRRADRRLGLRGGAGLRARVVSTGRLRGAGADDRGGAALLVGFLDLLTRCGRGAPGADAVHDLHR